MATHRSLQTALHRPCTACNDSQAMMIYLIGPYHSLSAHWAMRSLQPVHMKVSVRKPRRSPCRPARRAVVGIPGRKQAHDSELHQNGVTATGLAVPSARDRRARQQVVQVSEGAFQDVIKAVQVDLAEEHTYVGSDQALACFTPTPDR